MTSHLLFTMNTLDQEFGSLPKVLVSAVHGLANLGAMTSKNLPHPSKMITHQITGVHLPTRLSYIAVADIYDKAE